MNSALAAYTIELEKLVDQIFEGTHERRDHHPIDLSDRDQTQTIS